VGRDELVITEHPVERGAAISDHAFVRPVEIEMTCGWSDSTAGYVGYIDEVYAELIALQKEREPFDVTSGKRTYENMLLAQVLQQTDERSENILMVTARFREVLIVSTETTSAPNSAQSNPSKTGSRARTGWASPAPARGREEVGMATQDFPLAQATAQEMQITLGSLEYTVRFYFIDTAEGGWMMDLYDLQQRPLARGLALVAGEDVLQQHKYLGVQGEIRVLVDQDPLQEPTFENFGGTGRVTFTDTTV
jgi:hypothetical protein